MLKATITRTVLHEHEQYKTKGINYNIYSNTPNFP